MLKVRKSENRGLANHGWLKSRHTFSFAEYYDPEHMGFRDLRVINEDRIAGGTGFGAHPHRDMEIISYVISGALEHQDSTGTKAIIKPGEVQRMSAGSGIVHSEKNSKTDLETHFFQIWIMPRSSGGPPSYGQKSFEEALNSQDLVLVVSSDSREGSIGIKQDVDMYISRLKKNQKFEFLIRQGRGLWLQMISGKLSVNEKLLEAGDAVSVENLEALKISATENSEFILFDLN